MNRFYFRVWNKKTKSWVHGPKYEPHLFGETILLGAWMRVPIKELDDCVPLQCSGMLDKNGNRIFEGDVVDVTNGKHTNRFEVKFGPVRRTVLSHDGTQHFELELNSFYFERDGQSFFPIVENADKIHDLQMTEIVGNVYDNPELLLKN